MDTQIKSRGEVLIKAKRYSNIKYLVAFIDIIYLLFLIFLFQGLGVSGVFADYIRKLAPEQFLIIPGYLFLVFFLYSLLHFPLNFYQSFILEHKFSLSNQKIGDWWKDQFKSAVVVYVIILILFEAFYYILKQYPGSWWMIISAFWIFFSLVLARLTPVIIIPLFFKYKRLSDETLRQRIVRLADKVKVKIIDVFEIDFSKKTLKANAAFVGSGKTRRIILADTLKDKYSYDEIEVIIAHEFAHYKLKHLLKIILVNSLATVLSFYFIFMTSNYVLNIFGLYSLSDIAAFPLVIMYMAVFGIIMQPLENYISRGFEKDADKMALKITGLKEPFISMMEKLSSQNLADKNPHPLIKFFFFDHPPIDERVDMAKKV